MVDLAISFSVKLIPAEGPSPPLSQYFKKKIPRYVKNGEKLKDERSHL